MKDFLKAGKPQLSLDFNPGILIPLVLVWLSLIVIMALGVQKGVGAANVVFMPLLILMFVGLVAYSLTLPGAMTGLNTLFSPTGERWLTARSGLQPTGRSSSRSPSASALWSPTPPT